MADAPLLRAQHLTRTYPRMEEGGTFSVLRDLSLEVESGSSVALMGPSGSGKTTLLHLLAALTRPDSGQVWLEGERIDDLAERSRASLRRRKIGFIFQDHALLRHLSAIENVVLPTLGARDLAVGVAERARGLLEEAGLGDRLHHRPSALSLGQCQRVAVCRARINRPKLLLADEPTGSLDRTQADALMDDLLTAHARQGCALLVVTHDERVASRMGRVLDLVDGRLRERRSVEGA